MTDLLMKYEKLKGEAARIENEYLSRRRITRLYSKEQLKNPWGVDLYLLLDLDMYRTQKIPKDILSHVVKVKKYFYHPDLPEGSNEAFVLVKMANEILGDPRLRLIYNSNFFDDAIPEDRIYYSDEFFHVFGECFERNGKFSVRQPVPQLKPNDDIKSVEEFYEFWSNFKSWRTYENPDEFYKMNLQDRSRYTMNHQEQMKQSRNKDILRIKKLVQIAKKRDPRIGKSIVQQVMEMKVSEWSDQEIATLKRLLMLFNKTSKNKWEVITEKLVEITGTKRSVDEVMKKVQEIGKK
ncbi:zuotin-like protein [Ordospora colligata]|uniref:Zuotin-like protein n=1 Tax=Ordospora colligata OC4 TaxID=1354746 RepID=A0A0B2UH32_9MICR|nr:zuotin-like protein [Ordospora colligata OC4]KHN70371.1 zuotin-like protein [Ordospora colligata OC4]TBU17121.1 zuotin-like protein [Ordospora colligata]TBU17371.1 zuotin-like protein [Ordospora colligata]TBU19551.1 zuotin-like protein [Ordospora colligata]